MKSMKIFLAEFRYINVHLVIDIKRNAIKDRNDVKHSVKFMRKVKDDAETLLDLPNMTREIQSAMVVISRRYLQ